MNYVRKTFGGRVRVAFVAGSASVLLLGAALAGPAMAAEQAAATQAIGPHTHQLHGTVKNTPSSGATTFMVTTERYGDVTVSIGEVGASKSQGRAHGKARAFAMSRIDDLEADTRVVVLGRASADAKSFVARRVHVLPDQDEADTARAKHLTGTISNASTSDGNTTLTIKLADATTQTVTVNADTKIRPAGKSASDLKADVKVTVVVKDGKATGVVILPA
jgi:hypothetical protein